MIGYMWVKYKYRIGIVFWWKNNAWAPANRENTFSGQSVSHIPSPLFAGQPLLEPLFGLLLSVSLPLALDMICILYQRLSPAIVFGLFFLYIMVLPCWHWGNQCIMIVEMTFNISIFGKWLHSQRENFMSQIFLQCTVKIWILISFVYIYQRDAHDDASMKRETLINCC